MHPGGENDPHHEGDREPEEGHALLMALEILKCVILIDYPIFRSTNINILHLIREIPHRSESEF
jgi:hypothetical protein